MSGPCTNPMQHPQVTFAGDPHIWQAKTMLNGSSWSSTIWAAHLDLLLLGNSSSLLSHLSLSDFLLFQEVEPRGVLGIVLVLDRQMMRMMRLGRSGEWTFVLHVSLFGDFVRNIVGVVYMTFPWLTGQGWLSPLLSVFTFLIPFFVLSSVNGRGSKGNGRQSCHPLVGSCL